MYYVCIKFKFGPIHFYCKRLTVPQIFCFFERKGGTSLNEFLWFSTFCHKDCQLSLTYNMLRFNMSAERHLIDWSVLNFCIQDYVALKAPCIQQHKEWSLQTGEECVSCNSSRAIDRDRETEKCYCTGRWIGVWRACQGETPHFQTGSALAECVYVRVYVWMCLEGATLQHTVQTVYAYQPALSASLSWAVYLNLFWENSTWLDGISP